MPNQDICIATLVAKSNTSHISDTTCVLCFGLYPSNLQVKLAVQGDGNQDSWVSLVDAMEDVDMLDYEAEYTDEGSVSFNCEVDGALVGIITLTRHPLY